MGGRCRPLADLPGHFVSNPRDFLYGLRMDDRIKLPMSFDVARLQHDLRQIQDEDWTDHFVKQNYEGKWSAVPLRAPALETHPIRMIYSDPTCTDFRDTAYLRAAPYIRKALEALHCPLMAVRLMKLTAGSRIKEHTDYDLCAEEGVARLHIPIQSNDRVDFVLNERPVKLEEGSCWYLRLSDPHSVENNGDEDRVHIVIDVVVDDWLRTHLQEAASSA